MWIVGRRGIKFQDKDGNMVERAPGEPIPEAEGFPNIRVLKNSQRIEWVEEPPKKVEPIIEAPEILASASELSVLSSSADVAPSSVDSLVS